jgi:hypothetical protein
MSHALSHSGVVSSAGTVEAPTWRERFKDQIRRYGKLVVVIHLSIFFVTWAGFAFAISAGFQVGASASGAGFLGLMAAAYLPTQLTKPPRVLLTLALTPAVARRLGREAPESPQQ